MDNLRIPLRSRMQLTFTAAAFIGILTVTAANTRAGDSPTSLDVYGGLPTLEAVTLSPDGTKVAFIKTKGDQRSLIIVGLARSEVIGGAPVGDIKLRAIQWRDNENLLITVSR